MGEVFLIRQVESMRLMDAQGKLVDIEEVDKVLMNEVDKVLIYKNLNYEI